MNNAPLKQAWWCVAVANGDFILIETFSGYASSCRDSKGARHFLDPDARDEAIGMAVLDALEHSRFVLPRDDMSLYDYELTKKNYAAWIADLMSRYGYGTKRALFKNMKNCHVRSESGLITICPSYHDRLNAGLEMASTQTIMWWLRPTVRPLKSARVSSLLLAGVSSQRMMNKTRGQACDSCDFSNAETAGNH